MKKTIIFFSRMGLTYIYGALHKELDDVYNIRHIAYSQKEAKILSEEFNISVDSIFLDEIKNNYNKKIDPVLLTQIEDDYQIHTNKRFTLNSAIISDRGFKYLSYDESLQLAQTYYMYWSEFLKVEKENKFVFFHETTSLLFNHICSMQCQKYGGVYTGFIGSKGLADKNFRFVEFDTGRSMLLQMAYNTSKYDAEVKQKAQAFIKRHRQNSEKMTMGKGSALSTDLLYAGYYLLKKLQLKFYSGDCDRVVENTGYYIYNNPSSEKYFNRLIYKFKLEYDEFHTDDTFLFYPMHIEPEAVVQYWSAGVYTNQINLIEQLARNLPVGYYLYVKDHVAAHGYRSMSDYDKIKAIPNVKLIDPRVSGLALAKRSNGVITINGTLGFEGLMLGKPVYILGSVYYDCFKHIIKIEKLKDLKKCVLEPYTVTEEEIELFVTSYLETAYHGNIVKYFTPKSLSRIKNEDLISFKNIFEKYISEILSIDLHKGSSN